MAAFEHTNLFIHIILPDFQQFNPEYLTHLVVMKMPFGKFKGMLLCDLPVSYLEWFQRKGFPEGKLGMLLATMYEIQINGLNDLLRPLKKNKESWKRMQLN